LELAYIDTQSQLNLLTIARCHPKVSETSSLHHHDVVGEFFFEFDGPERR
jgi:hypothetical protein